ncbi:MAG: alpha/beta hydrolase [Thermoleophilaceae bacterium]
MLTRTAVIALAGLAFAAPAGGAGTPAWPICVPRTSPVLIGIHEVGRLRQGRVVTLRLRSRAMGDVQPVNVLLPAHYDASGRTRYHVLYLLHGAGGDYQSWLRQGAQRLLGSLPVIAVMPNGSEPSMDGNYTDWQESAPGGRAPAWESFHIRELVPFIDAHFPTLASAAGRAIAGISMGGGGATKYAAEYPGTFGYAATFSGEAHPLLPLALAFQNKTCRWGDPAKNEVIWRDNDSTDLAGNLSGVRVFVRTGNGTPGPFDFPEPPAGSPQATIRQLTLTVEFGAGLENQALVKALRAAHVRGVDARFFDGSHSLPYWQRDTRELVPWLRRQFRHPPRTPATATVASAHTWFTAWGWTFQVKRRVREFVYLKLTRHGIRATGSGKLLVTPPSGHSFVLDLGPSHTHQQTQFGRSALGGWRTVSATIGQ